MIMLQAVLSLAALSVYAATTIIVESSTSTALLTTTASLTIPSISISATSTTATTNATITASTSVTNASSSLLSSTSTSTSTSSSSTSTSSSSTFTISSSTSTISSSTFTISSSTSTISSSTSTSSSSTSTSSLVTTTQSIIPVTPISFSPFPAPSDPAIPGIFPATDPSNPPPVGAPVVPDFLPAWKAAYAKAKKVIANFSLEEKVNVTTGVGWQNGLCVGNIPPVQSWPGLCLEDSPLGVRFGDFVTAFPAGINAATTWNRDLIRRRGLFMGREHRGKGVNIALGPMMNMGRVAEGGRNWEGFGADPFLAGEAAYETILGMQDGGVQACAKHLINNEQETSRTTESSDVDDRTEHEIYAHPFMRSIMAGVASIMCSYNLINGTYACENNKILNDIVKREFGFQGFIMSDWSATHSTMSAAEGLDMTMPGDITFDSGTSYFGANLTAFVQNGTIPEARVDDMATRIIAAWFFLHQDSPSYPKTNFNAFAPFDETTNLHIDVQDDHYKLVREMGAASTVLLKNVNQALPLKKPRSIALFGSDAGPGRIGPNEFADQGGTDGILAMGWGSGTANFTYLISPLEAIQQRSRKDRTSISWMLDDANIAYAQALAPQKSVAIVFIQSDSGEQYILGGDRQNLTALHGGDDLVLAVAAKNNNTMVVVHSVGPLILEPWIEHPNVTAVLWAGLPGTEAGNALTDVLYGDWNPSGRLPYTIAKSISDYPAQLTTGGGPTQIVDIPYTEGLEIDYRHFDAKNITPRFEFGFGLSYTTFDYSNLHISKIASATTQEEKDWEAGKATAIAEGSTTASWLHVPAYNVTFTVKNTGAVYGGEIPQVYLNMPPSAGEPPSILKGFTHIELVPEAAARVGITLTRYDVSIWDSEAQGWRKPSGTTGVTVGKSSRRAVLEGHLP